MALVPLSSFGIEPGQTFAEAQPQIAIALSRTTGYSVDQPLTIKDLDRHFVFSDVFLRNSREAMATAAKTVAGNNDGHSCLKATTQTASFQQHWLKNWKAKEPATETGPQTLPVEKDTVSGGNLRPQPEQFADRQAYLEAFLSYQDGKMAELKALYPKAWLPPCEAWRLFYGTGEVTPEQAMESGIPPKNGENFDLLAHQTEGTQTLDGEALDPQNPAHGTGLRGGSRTATVSSHCGAHGGYVYMIEPRGGAISLSDALGHKESRFCSNELEAAFGSCQPPERIVGWYKVGAYSDFHDAYRLGNFVPNPKYCPLDD